MAFKKFFDFDVVYGINEENLVDIGMLMDTMDPEDPNYYFRKLNGKRNVEVQWWRKSGVNIAEEKVKLCDRFVQPGDVVRKIVKGKDTQLGYCRYTDVKVDLQVIGTGKVIVGVDSKDLIPMKELMPGVAVYKDSWVGMVKKVKTELKLRCSDGSRCIMSDDHAFRLEDVLDKRLRVDRFFPVEKYSFYLGQQLWGPTSCFHGVKWLNVTKSMSDTIKCCNKSVCVTVEDVKIISADIQWVCKAYSSEESARNPVVAPKYHVSRKNLKSIKMMNMLEPCTLQIGDTNFLIMKENFEVISLDEWKNRMSSRFYESHNNSPLHKRTKSNKASTDTKDNCVDANANCNDAINVCDDNCDDIKDEESGKSSKAASVTSRFTASSVDIGSSGHKQRKKSGTNYATKLVKKKKSEHMMNEILLLKPGEKLITEALITETKADVVWQDGTVEHNILSTCLYPVYPGHYFFPGDLVDRKETRPYEYGVVKQVDDTEKTALITWMKEYHAGGDPHPEVLSEEEVCVYDIEHHPDFKYRPGTCVLRVGNSEDSNPASSAGQVVYVHSTGKVEVAWVSGETSLCYPQELYTAEDLWASELFSYKEDTWGAIDVLNNEDELGDKDKDDDKSMEDMREKLLANIEKLRAGMARIEEVSTQNPTLQTGNVMRRLLELHIKHCKVLHQLLGTTYFHDRPQQSLVELLKHWGINSIQHMADQIFRLFSSSEANFEMNEAQSPNTEEDVAEVNSVGTFSMLESVPDHHLYKLTNFQPTDPRAFFRIVWKEMSILRSSLPEGIVVKSFEDRIDLYSVLIKGPKGTPYEDGLFFFDFRFPADYPKVPPLCRYISYCSDEFIPNLFEGGKVHMSLLGTVWSDKRIEKWNPGTSNLLQVIVSIQDLLLVAEPSYKEPFYGTLKGTQVGREISRNYNEMVVSKLVHAMTKLLLNPPEIFKQEITEHFQTQASKLTQRLEMWLAMSETWNSERPASPNSPSTSKELHNCDTSPQDVLLPEFPLIPASKGFSLSLRKSLAEFKEVLSSSSIV